MVLFALITSIKAKYFGDPIEVHATFEVVKEDLEETKDTTLRASLDDTKEEMMQSESTFYSTKKKRPRPYLNAYGQIEFHSTSTTSKPYTASTIRYTYRRNATSQTTKSTNYLTKSTVLPIKSRPTFASVMSYKPTFKPPIIFAEVANIEVTLPPKLTSSKPNSLESVTEIDEKINLTSTLNQLSSNSVVNILVVFGLPAVTALLSFLGAGPLAIASVAWLIPIAAVMVLPELRRNED